MEPNVRRVLAAVPVGMSVATDPQCRRIWPNPVLANWLGVPADPGRPPGMLDEVPTTYRILRDGRAVVDVSELPLQQAVTSRAAVREVELGIVRADGQRKNLLAFAAPTLGDGGEITGAIFTCIELTGRLMGRQYQEVLARVAHELRNPLGPMVTGLDLLRRLLDVGPRVGRVLDGLERQARHMTRLVGDLLDLSAVASGRFQLARSSLDLGPLVSNAAADHATQFERSGIRLTCTRPDRPVIIRGDQSRLTQVIANVLHNALKFTPAGGSVRVQLEVRQEWAELRIRDDGAGIDPVDVATLFQPFTTVAPRKVGRGQGLGVGLTIVREVVDLHGGRVHAESQGSGRGTTVTVCLPLAEHAAGASDDSPLPP